MSADTPSTEASSKAAASAEAPSEDEDRDQRPVCDFCGERSDQVRRVALDGDYERLRTRHTTRYACPSCSAKKEREREAASD